MSTSVLARVTAAAALILLAAMCCGTQQVDTRAPMSDNVPKPDSAANSPLTVIVSLAGPDGQPLPPAAVPKVVKTDAEWRRLLTPEQYRVARGRGTEPAFCGGLLSNKGSGIYNCVCCSLPLFASSAKFESGTGWPSFFEPFAAENIVERQDRTLGMARTEILCARCDAHLGHVFPDGPPPTGLRYCLNSAALFFIPNK